MGSTRPTAPTRSATVAKAATGSLQLVHQTGDEQVADRMPGEGATAAEAMLEQAGPHRLVGCQSGERGQGHPQVAGREQPQLVADAAGRPAVVGDGDNGRQLAGELPQRGQRGVQPVPATQGDHAQAADGVRCLTHGRGPG